MGDLNYILKKIKSFIEKIEQFYSTCKTRLGINKWLWRRIQRISKFIGIIFTIYRAFEWIIVALFKLF